MDHNLVIGYAVKAGVSLVASFCHSNEILLSAVLTVTYKLALNIIFHILIEESEKLSEINTTYTWYLAVP
jgi:hypothetical protein